MIVQKQSPESEFEGPSEPPPAITLETPQNAQRSSLVVTENIPQDARRSWREGEGVNVKMAKRLNRDLTSFAKTRPCTLNPFVLPAAYNTEHHTHGIPNDPFLIPYPHGSDGQGSFENLRKKLQEIPQFMMDFDGYVPNSEIRELLENWYAEYLKILESRKPPAPVKFASLRVCAKSFKQEIDEAEKIALTHRLLKRIKIKKPKLTAGTANQSKPKPDEVVASAPAEVIPTQLAGAEDEFMVDDADRTVNKADAARLRQVKREVTQETLIQKIHDKERQRLNARETLAASRQETSSYIDVPELVTEAPDDLQRDHHSTVLPRAEVDRALQAVRQLVGGSDGDAVELIVAALNDKPDSIASLRAILPDSTLRHNFLHSVTQPGYVFYLLVNYFKGRRAVFNMLDIVLDDVNDRRKVERMALSRKMSYILGEKSSNTRLQEFARALDGTCEVAIECLVDRMMASVDEIPAVASAFHECLCGEDIQMAEFADAAKLTAEQLDEIVWLTTTCQADAVVAYIGELTNVMSGMENGSPTSTFKTESRFKVDIAAMDGGGGGGAGAAGSHGRGGSGSLSKLIPIEDGSEDSSPQLTARSGKSGHLQKHRSGTTEDTDIPSVVHMAPPPLAVKFTSTDMGAAAAPQRGLVLKGKTLRRLGAGSPRGVAKPGSGGGGGVVFNEPPTASFQSGAGKMTYSDVSSDRTLDDQTTMEEDVNEDSRDAANGPSYEMPDLMSPEQSEEEEDDSESDDGDEVGHKKHRHHHKRRHHHHHHEVEVSPTDDGRETSEIGGFYSTVSKSTPEEPRPMTAEEVMSRAVADETTCMKFLSFLKMANSVEDAEEATKKLLRVIRNEEGTMDVDAIMRIFHELQNLSQFLEQQVAELPDSDAEKTVVLGMVKVMRRTAEELFPHDDEAKAEEEQAEKNDEGPSRTDRLRARLEAMVKRRKPPKIRPRTAGPTISTATASSSSSASSSSQGEVAVFGIAPRRSKGGVNNTPSVTTSVPIIDTTVFVTKATTTVVPSEQPHTTTRISAPSDEEHLPPPPVVVASDESHKELLTQSGGPSIAEVMIGKISNEKWRSDFQPNSKMVQSIKRKSRGFTRALLKDDVLRRQQTRLLIEKMQKKIQSSSVSRGGSPDLETATTRALTPNQIREMLSNPDFEEIALEFKNLYGSEIWRSDGSVLSKIVNQMDRISTKVGEEPEIDKMVNLLSVLRAQDRKFTAGELLDEYFEELSQEELKYLEDMLNVVKELLLVEIAITHALIPPQRLAWMSVRDNWDNQRRCLAILGQLMQLQVVSPDLGSIIVSSLVMNVFDVIAAFNARDIICNEAEKMIYAYIKDELEALTWFGVRINDNTEVLKPLSEEYDYDLGNVLAGEDNHEVIRPSVDKSLLDLVVAPGYMYVLKTGTEKGFSVSKVDDRSERVAFIEYMLRLRQATLRATQKNHSPQLSPVEIMAQQVEKVLLTLRSSATVAAALEATSMQEPAMHEFQNLYSRVVPELQRKRACEVFHSVITAPLTKRKDEVEGLLFTRDTDHEIMGELEETNCLLNVQPASKQATSQATQRMVYQLYSFGREISTVDPNDVTRILTQKIDGKHFYSPGRIEAISPTQERMYTIKDAKDHNVTVVDFPGLNYNLHPREISPIRGERPKTPVHLPRLKTSEDGVWTHYETIGIPSRATPRQKILNPPNSAQGLWRMHSSNDEWESGEPIDVHYKHTKAYREGRTLHVASKGYPLEKEEVAAVEASLPPSPTLPATLWETYDLLRVEEESRIPLPPPTKSNISCTTTTNGTNTTAQQRSSGMEQDTANTLLADMASVHFLMRNPAAILEQLRQRLKPGGLTDVLDDIIASSASRRSRKIFVQALQRALNVEKESYRRIHRRNKEPATATTTKGRLVKRPLSIPARDWQRLAKSETSVSEKLPSLRPDQPDSQKPVHCKADAVNRIGYPKAGLSVGSYLTRGNVLEHIQKSNHIRAHERIQSSIVECLERVASDVLKQAQHEHSGDKYKDF